MKRRNKKKASGIVTAFVLAAFIVASVAGCGKETPGDSGNPGDKGGGTGGKQDVLTVAINGDVGDLSPFSTSATAPYLWNQIYEPLFDQGYDMEMTPLLAESWEQVDQTHYTMKIREGVTDSEGNTFTAHDAVFVFETYTTDAENSTYVANIDFDKTVASDDYTLELYLLQPNNYTFTNLSGVRMFTKAAWEAIMLKEYFDLLEAVKAQKNFKAVIFDMDGVLIDSEMIYLEDLLGFARTKNPRITLEGLIGVVGRTARDTWSIVEQAVGNGQDWEELREEYRAKRTIYETVDYRKIFQKEATGVLRALKDQGYRLAVASSTSLPLVTRVLTENEIIGYFDQVVSGNMFRQSKPDPEIYHYTAGKLGVREEECLVIEDSTVGITAAYRAGMTVAAVIDDRFGFDRSLADFEIETIGGVLECLKKLEA